MRLLHGLCRSRGDSVSYACQDQPVASEGISVIWRFAKDVFFSCVISVGLIMFAIVGLMCHVSQGSYASRPEYKIRARETMKRSMEFILSPVERPDRLVPDSVESIPVIGDASLAVANIATFTPCFWAVVAFIVIRMNRFFKIVTKERLLDHFEAKYGQFAKFTRRPPTVDRPSKENSAQR